MNPPKPPQVTARDDGYPDLIVHNASLVLTCAGKGPRRGSEQDDLHAVPDGAVAGPSYEELHAAGGGIQATVDATRKMRVADLVESARGRLWSMFFAGVTTFEAKSGYGLSVASEMTQLQAIRELDAEGPWELVPTFLGAHALPRECADDRGGYVDLVCEKMIPKVAALELAEFCDVFCERGAFTVEESRRILQTGQAQDRKSVM